MNRFLYGAAMEGNIGDVRRCLRLLEIQRTPNKNTALHVAAMFGKALCAKEILRNRPSLLLQVNIRGETPFHLAAREGHSETVRALIECAKALPRDLENGGADMAKDMLRMTNEDGDTPLHEAVRFRHLEVLKLLVQEDPEFPHPLNKAEETPLYLAVEKGLYYFVSEILRSCRSPSYVGPMRRTALHAAVIFDSYDCTKKLLNWKPCLLKEVDIEGRTPLHFAVRLGHFDTVNDILLKDRSVAYIAENNIGKKTALHIAASLGHVNIMECLIWYCPDCWESVDGEGLNIFHIAIKNGRKSVMEYILKTPMLSSLINQKDLRGNTPLHYHSLDISTSNDLLLARDPRVEKMAFNKENLTPLDLAIHEGPNDEDKKAEQLKRDGLTLGFRNDISFKIESNKYRPAILPPKDPRKAADTHMIVAALVVTITFTAGFTIPGGYDGNEGPKQGMAILGRRVAFRAFMISDTIALLLSTLALVIHFTASLYENRMLLNLLEAAASLISIALSAMMVAFVAGTYVVLQQSSGTLAIATCIIGSCFFPLYYLVVRKLFRALSITMSHVRRFLKRLVMSLRCFLFLLIMLLLWLIKHICPCIIPCIKTRVLASILGSIRRISLYFREEEEPTDLNPLPV